jgi:hypothetical protein
MGMEKLEDQTKVPYENIFHFTIYGEREGSVIEDTYIFVNKPRQIDAKNADAPLTGEISSTEGCGCS